MSKSLREEIEDLCSARRKAAMREAMDQLSGHSRGSTRDKRNNGIWIAATDWDTKIYRVFSWKWLLKLLQEKRMGLMRPRRWDDPFENFLLKCTVVSHDGSPVSLEKVEGSWYGQCWTMNADSDALWRIYSPNKDGVRVSTTVGHLFDAIYDENDEFASLNYFIGMVRYYERAEIEKLLNEVSFFDMTGGGPIQFAALLCVKRPEFEHEKEVRILIRDDKTCFDIREIELDPFALFDELVLDPRLNSDAFECQTKQLRAVGWTKAINQSDLYKIELKTIPLS